MTTIVGGADGTSNSFDSDSLKAIASWSLGSHSSTQFTLSDSPDYLTAQGTGIGYSSNHPSSGTITSLSYSTGGDPSAWSGFSVSVSSAWNAISSGDVNSFDNLFFGGDDTFNMQASNGQDSLQGGAGNDTFNYAGNFGGFTHIDGGTGTDTLSLDGDYYGYNPLGYVTNVEIFKLAAGHYYSLAYAPASALTVDASALQAGDSANFENLGGSGTLTMNGGAGNDTLILHPGGANIFNGGGGSDTIDFSHATGAINVNLNLTTAQSVGGGMGSVTLNSVENIIASNYNDTLTGNASDNTFVLGTGIYKIDGGAGNDTVSFQNATAGVTIDLRPGGNTGGDTFTSIESVTGSNYGDTFIGNSDDNVFNAGGHLNAAYDLVTYQYATGPMTFTMTNYVNGVSTIVATGGGQGTDTLINFTKIVGTAYDDTFYFTEAAVMPDIDAGGGTNSISFQNAAAGVTFYLGPHSGMSSQFTSIQNVTGSAFDDTINGDNGNNVLNGGAGNDTIYGDSYGGEIGGNDVINGGDGNDTLYGGGGSIGDYGNDILNGGNGDDTLYGGGYQNDSNGKDILDGGPGNDTFYGGANDIVTYQDATSGVTVDLSSNDPQNVGGGMGTDTLEFISNVQGSNFDDTLHGNDYNNFLNGMDGNDVIDISSNGPIFARGGSDTVWGGNGNDTIIAGPDLTASDQIDGGAGTDTLTLNGDYSAGLVFAATTMVNVEVLMLSGGNSYNLTLNDANVAAGQTLTVDGSALDTGNTLIFDGSHETDGNFVVKVGAGPATLTGGAGNDTFVFETSINAADVVDGGAGNNTVELNGDYSAGLTLEAAMLTNIETLRLDAGHNYDLVMGAGSVAAGKAFVINASGLGAADTLNFDGSQVTDANFAVTGGAGNDVFAGGGGNDTFNGGAGLDTVSYADATSGVTAYLWAAAAQNIGGGQGSDTLISIENLTGSAFNDTLGGNSGNNVIDGGAGDDTFDMWSGGNDTVLGGDGNDTFNFGAALTSADMIDGGTGTDTLLLAGNYSAGVVFSATTMTNVEKIAVSNGFSYNLTFNDANVAAGQTLTVDGHVLTGTNALIVDGSQETDGNFVFLGGAGNDVFTGGSGADTFQGGAGDDTMNGGGGIDTVSYAAATGGVTANLSLTTAQAIGGGQGNDTLIAIENIIGSNFNDTLSGNSSDNVINGGGGVDTVSYASASGGVTVNLSLSTAQAVGGGQGSDTLVSIENLTGSNFNDVLSGNSGDNVINGGGGVDTVSYAGATSGVNVNLSLATAQAVGGGQGNDTLVSIENLTGSNFNDTLHGNAGNNVLSGLGGNDNLDLSAGGNDTALGGDGNDTISFGATFTAADHVDGGAGIDTLNLDGDYSAGVVLGAQTMVNVEAIGLAGGYSYKLTMNDANVAAGQTLIVNGSALGASDTLTFTGTQEKDGNFNIIGGQGNDTITGGAGNDTITGGLGADHLTGGAGSDTFVYNAAAQSTGPNYDTITGFDFAADKIDLKFAVNAIDAKITTGSLSAATFNSDLAAAVDHAHLGSYDAVLFTASAGDLAGDTFLVIDANGAAGYQADKDIVILMDHATYAASISTADFI